MTDEIKPPGIHAKDVNPADSPANKEEKTRTELSQLLQELYVRISEKAPIAEGIKPNRAILSRYPQSEHISSLNVLSTDGQRKNHLSIEIVTMKGVLEPRGRYQVTSFDLQAKGAAFDPETPIFASVKPGESLPNDKKEFFTHLIDLSIDALGFSSPPPKKADPPRRIQPDRTPSTAPTGWEKDIDLGAKPQ